MKALRASSWCMEYAPRQWAIVTPLSRGATASLLSPLLSGKSTQKWADSGRKRGKSAVLATSVIRSKISLSLLAFVKMVSMSNHEIAVLVH